jgi:hypothetical protein
MVSWHRALYRAFFRVPWRALVPVPPSHAPQLSNLYLQSAGGRVALGQSGTACDLPPRLCPASLPSTCTPPHLRIPSSSCKAPCTGCAESGLHRCPRGSPRRSPCCWGCRAPRSTPHTRSPGRPSSPCLQRAGNRVQDAGCWETPSGTAFPGFPVEPRRLDPRSPARPQFSCNPPLPRSPFFLATAEVSARRARRARRKKPRCCILGSVGGEEHGSRVLRPSPFSPGAACKDLPLPLAQFSRPSRAAKGVAGGLGVPSR